MVKIPEWDIAKENVKWTKKESMMSKRISICCSLSLDCFSSLEVAAFIARDRVEGSAPTVLK